MSGKLVLIPCRLDRRDAKSALIEDADGWPRRVIGPLGRADGRLVVAGTWVREANGRHRVRFDDGTELWTVYGPRPDIDFVRFGATAPGPIPVAQTAGPVDASLAGRGNG
jgi:hypothetical protein